MAEERQRVGLCLECIHSRVVVSGRGSRFYLCQLAETDARFRKYPPLPVVACARFEAVGEGFRVAKGDAG